ncbi:cytokine-inducible SH2-containing protein-like [Corythoichthys intestinalis]|uniref:cytokine-inducible SH2-containing protein-like n=1 Tax=Corythoichthys intestinalis TaxID=161448 RepID=UPI0025A63DBE|nr:cytokine-inducible SH2-containing protein-like [Corythoichthys intestinalis]XP_061814318.1 cytokine-inducible SH2-containing protein-like [Nerophis lumbriciformis]
MVAPTGTTAHRVDPGSCPHLPNTSWDRDEDLSCIATTFHYLNTSGWYWGSISASQARDKLLAKSEGTFLVRDSSHPQYMVALSVMTQCGPTSVRIQYRRGSFWLDSLSPELPQLQSFPDVISLVQWYTTTGQAPQGPAASIEDNHLSHKRPDHVLVPSVKDNGVILKLLHPLHRPETFPRLQHLARLAINRNTNCPDQLPLPKSLLNYLHDYPFHI